MRTVIPSLLVSVFSLTLLDAATDTAGLPELPPAPPAPPTDWLIDPTPYRAAAYRGENPQELVLANGLLCPCQGDRG